MAEIAPDTPDASAALLASAGIRDAAQRVIDEPAIAMVLGMSRALRGADLDGVAPWSSLRGEEGR